MAPGLENGYATAISSHPQSLHPPRKTLILDLGDVLFHWTTRNLTALSPSTFHAVVLSPTWGLLECGKISEDDAISAIAAELGLSCDKIREAIGQCKGTLRVDFELVGKLMELKKEVEGLRVYAMTNIAKNDFVDLKETLKDWSLFDGEFTSFGVGMIKPELGYYSHVLKSLNITDPASAIFVDDKVVNVTAAQSFGLHGIVFESAPSLLRQLRNKLLDPIARGHEYLRKNARAHFSQIENGAEIRDVFSQFLIQYELQDPSLVSLSTASASPKEIERGLSSASTSAKTWNYFIDQPVGTTVTCTSSTPTHYNIQNISDSQRISHSSATSQHDSLLTPDIHSNVTRFLVLIISCTLLFPSQYLLHLSFTFSSSNFSLSTLVPTNHINFASHIIPLQTRQPSVHAISPARKFNFNLFIPPHSNALPRQTLTNPTTYLVPDDVDSTSYALLSFHPPASQASPILDKLLANRSSSHALIQTYLDPLRPRTCPVVLVNVLRAFYMYSRGDEVLRELEYVKRVLLNRAYLHGSAHYLGSEAFLYFLSRLFLAHEGSSPEIAALRVPLQEALRERVGRRDDSFAVAARVLACQAVGVWCGSDVTHLKELQDEDGGWEIGWVCRFGRTRKRIGSRGVVTAFAVKALEAEAKEAEGSGK